jgi:ABC-type glycerol-3-phosphate transport system substrate-binding protein
MYKGHPMGVNHTGISSFGAMVYNRSMIQRVGLADPQTLVASKQWTWAKYEEYCKKLAKDTNNDGKLDQYGSTDPKWLWQSVVASNAGKIVSEIGGKDVYTLNKPAAIEALKWIGRLGKENIFGGDMTDFANGKVGFVWWLTYDNGFRSTMKD